MLSTHDEATQSENGVISQWETVGPIDTTHTQPIQSVCFHAGSGASSEYSRATGCSLEGYFATRHRQLSAREVVCCAP